MYRIFSTPGLKLGYCHARSPRLDQVPRDFFGVINRLYRSEEFEESARRIRGITWFPQESYSVSVWCSVQGGVDEVIDSAAGIE
jgi:hypothetical protein